MLVNGPSNQQPISNASQVGQASGPQGSTGTSGVETSKTNFSNLPDHLISKGKNLTSQSNNSHTVSKGTPQVNANKIENDTTYNKDKVTEIVLMPKPRGSFHIPASKIGIGPRAVGSNFKILPMKPVNEGEESQGFVVLNVSDPTLVEQTLNVSDPTLVAQIKKGEAWQQHTPTKTTQKKRNFLGLRNNAPSMNVNIQSKSTETTAPEAQSAVNEAPENPTPVSKTSHVGTPSANGTVGQSAETTNKSVSVRDLVKMFDNGNLSNSSPNGNTTTSMNNGIESSQHQGTEFNHQSTSTKMQSKPAGLSAVLNELNQKLDDKGKGLSTQATEPKAQPAVAETPQDGTPSANGHKSMGVNTQSNTEKKGGAWPKHTPTENTQRKGNFLGLRNNAPSMNVNIQDLLQKSEDKK